jgi:hypothetical protein
MEDIGNLVRKARIDFGAEIRFLDDSELDVRVHPELRDLFGSLDRVRAAVRNAPRGKGAYAALAEVRWSQPRAHGFIVYVKPGLRGDEPADVRHYAASNATFPHQPTSDQTFDEQQWESYRRLGDHIGERLLHTPSGAAAGQTVAGWMRAGAGPATTNGAPPEARQSAYD